MLYHIAEAAHWAAARTAGSYTTSTRGLALAEVGFIHLCTAEQVTGVATRFYLGADDLVLLHIDEHRCTAPIRFEPVGDSGDEFPHLYGELPVEAVVAVEPYTVPSDPGPSTP